MRASSRQCATTKHDEHRSVASQTCATATQPGRFRAAGVAGVAMTKRPGEIAVLAESGRLLAQLFDHLDRVTLIARHRVARSEATRAYRA